MTDEAGVQTTPIPGLLVVRLAVHADSRGWFKENWQREKMVALGLPDFGPVQNNVSFNSRRGTTRGIHAEPWDKFVSIVVGRAFCAWVDLRAGKTYGTVFTIELDPGVAVFVPRGVGNSYQTLDDRTAYSYLVNEHWRPAQTYAALRLDDPAVDIPWPIPLADAEVSEKDRTNPSLTEIDPISPRRPLILGAGGQLALALSAEFPEAQLAGVHDLDITDSRALHDWDWSQHDVVLNAAAWTDVDGAESVLGRQKAWQINAQAPAELARLATQHRLTLVHYSTDYVFDGSQEIHTEDESLSPLGVYGQSKAAGDLAVATAPRHYVLRTSWLVGDGRNFVATMAALAAGGVCPRVVADQRGRLTFASELARATRHLLESGAEFGTYNCTNSGEPTSWADVARRVFTICGREADDVTPVTTGEYAAGRPLAPRPANSLLDLRKLLATDFEPRQAFDVLEEHLTRDGIR